MRDLALVIEGIPGVDLKGNRSVIQDREGEVEAGVELVDVSPRLLGRIKAVPCRCRGNVLTRCEVCDFVGGWVAKQCELARVIRDVGEQAEEVFGIQLTPREGACNVDAALDILRKDGRVD